MPQSIPRLLNFPVCWIKVQFDNACEKWKLFICFFQEFSDRKKLFNLKGLESLPWPPDLLNSFCGDDCWNVHWNCLSSAILDFVAGSFWPLNANWFLMSPTSDWPIQNIALISSFGFRFEWLNELYCSLFNSLYIWAIYIIWVIYIIWADINHIIDVFRSLQASIYRFLISSRKIL